MNPNTFKIVLIGEGNVGKTTFLKLHLTGDFTTRHVATIGCEVDPLCFDTNYGRITFNIWDCAGEEQYLGLREGYYLKADAAIVFFDVTNQGSFDAVESWVTLFQKFAPQGEIVICGNKCDEKNRTVKPKLIQSKVSKNTYYDVSAKTNYNFEKPFLSLARTLTGHTDLVFSTATTKPAALRH